MSDVPDKPEDLEEASIQLPESDNFRNEESLYEEERQPTTRDETSPETKRSGSPERRPTSAQRKHERRPKSRPTTGTSSKRTRTRSSTKRSSRRPGTKQSSARPDSRQSEELQNYQQHRSNVFGDAPQSAKTSTKRSSQEQNQKSKEGATVRTQATHATKASAENAQKWRTEATKDGRIIVFNWCQETSPLGDSYIGEKVNDHYHGFGKMYFANGDKYVGEWKEGQFHGYGELMKAELIELGKRIVGRTYKGYWKDGYQYGHGIYFKGNGDTYEGYLKYNEYHGRGKIVYRDRTEYDGFWKYGVHHGPGILKYPSGAFYKGTFKAGMFHGQGIYKWAGGKGSYVGGWKHGLKHGVGKRIFSDDTRFEGWFFKDHMQGEGALHRSNGDSYKGSFWEGLYHGYGTMHYANGDRYVGQWQLAKPCGTGRFDYQSGGYYEGEYWALCRSGNKAQLEQQELDDVYGNISDPKWKHGGQQLTKVRVELLKMKKENEVRGRRSLMSQANSEFSEQPIDATAKDDFFSQQEKKEMRRKQMLGPYISRKIRRLLYDKRRARGRVVVGSEYDHPASRGVLRPMADGKRHGKGVRVWADGSRYEGDWFQDEIHGFGIYIQAGDLGERYEGSFKHGIREGRGVASWGNNSGGRYIDPFNRQMDGGTGRTMYSGEWHHGLFEGMGKMTSPVGLDYDGAFHFGTRHGYGTMVLMTEDKKAEALRSRRQTDLEAPWRYEGQWAKNKMTGKGKVLLVNGDTVSGEFDNGRYHGKMQWMKKSGRIYYREYRLGKLLREIEGDELKQLLQQDMATRVNKRGEQRGKSVSWKYPEEYDDTFESKTCDEFGRSTIEPLQSTEQ